MLKNQGSKKRLSGQLQSKTDKTSIVQKRSAAPELEPRWLRVCRFEMLCNAKAECRIPTNECIFRFRVLGDRGGEVSAQDLNCPKTLFRTIALKKLCPAQAPNKKHKHPQEHKHPTHSPSTQQETQAPDPEPKHPTRNTSTLKNTNTLTKSEPENQNRPPAQAPNKKH